MSALDTFLKRKSVAEGSNVDKKPKMENCPHSVKCYRRNPHHFKEFDHPHLNDFLEQEPVVLPPDYPQDREIVLAQLEILKGLKRPKPPQDHHKVLSQPGSSKPTINGKTISVRSTESLFDPNLTLNHDCTRLVPKKRMAERLADNAPYNLFFTTIPRALPTSNEENSITFTDLLCPSLGELKCSLQMNFMIDIAWLMEQYAKAGQDKKPLTIVYGDEFPDMKKYIEYMLPNVIEHHMKLKDPFGIHHSKVGIYVYTDNSLRVVVSTANLYFEDWNYYNQGLWISPLCPVLPEGSSEISGDGPTHFKTSLLTYLKEYNLDILKTWIDYIKAADFNAVKVFLVASAPGHHTPIIRPSQCHLHRVGELLSTHCSLPVKNDPASEGPLSWGIIAQASSIGSLGKMPGDWLRGALLRSLASHKECKLPASSNATINVVFPTKDNVLNSYYGPMGGGCLPYSKSNHEKQKWLNDYLNHWKADHSHRSRAMPHIKTYCRVSPCTTKLAWFFITSANISKAAWGSNINKNGSSYVRSFEVGVMFIPKLFDEEYFQIKPSNEGTSKLFPFIYDLPLTPYKRSDEPWCN